MIQPQGLEPQSSRIVLFFFFFLFISIRLFFSFRSSLEWKEVETISCSRQLRRDVLYMAMMSPCKSVVCGKAGLVHGPELMEVKQRVTLHFRLDPGHAKNPSQFDNGGVKRDNNNFSQKGKKWEGAAANTHKLLIDSFDSLKAPVVRKFCSTREREFSVLVFAEMTSGSAAN